MTAALSCVTLGIVATVRHADYIGARLEVLREDDRAIMRAASAASKAADYLLAFRPGVQTEAAVPFPAFGSVPAPALTEGDA